ncbi:MAG: peroxiredoxin [Myxococcales bacterium]|nr:MAG: peroxiredoxin [Myxococcales bacterium]
MLKVGEVAPDFVLPDQNGESQVFYKMKGSKGAVLFFYPKDGTPGCTAQSCSFRDNYQELKNLGVEIIGISADSPDSHKQFATQHSLPFALLSDESGEVRKKYGVKKTLGILPGRATFVVGLDGKIIFSFSSQLEIQKHVDEAVKVIKDYAQK